MRVAALAAVLILGAAAAYADASTIHAVIANRDGTHAAAELPLSDLQITAAKHIWAWTDDLPPRKFEPRDAVLEKLRNSPHRPLSVRVGGWSRAEELSTLRVIAAPRQMWLSVPEPLLPSFALTKDGTTTVQVDDAVRVRVVGEQFGTLWQDVGRGERAVDVLLRRPAADAKLTFRAGDGAAAGRVFAVVMTRRSIEAAPVPRAQFASNDKGVVTIPALPESEVITLFVTSEHAAPQTISGTATELTRTIRLPAAAQVRGRFVDEERRPLADVKVAAEGWASSDAPAASRADAVSDDAGVWRVRGLPKGQVMLRASVAGRATFRKRLELDEGGDADLGTIALLPSPSVVLTVTDAENEPVAGVKVTSDSGFTGTTDKRGVVTLTGLPVDDTSRIELTSSGFAKQTLELAPPLPAKARALLARAFSIKGKIVSETGAPVADAMAIVSIGTAERRERVDADGTFSIDVEPAKGFDVTFESPSAASVARSEQPGREGEVRDLGTIRLPSGLSVRGRVVDSAGAAVAGARVWAVRATAGATVFAWAGGRIVQAMTDADGNFDMRGLATGAALLRIDAPDYARAYRSVLVDTEPVDLGSIELTRGRTITVRARHGDAQTARVDLRGEWVDVDMISAPVVEGEARLRHVPAGTYRVTVVNARAVVCERTVDVKENSDAMVDCPAPMLVRGRVLLGGSAAFGGSLTWNQPVNTDALVNNRLSPMGALQQNVFGRGVGTVVVPVRSDGSFETTDLRPGEWQVAWRSAESGGTPDRAFVIPDRPEAQIVVEFNGGVIRGRVVDGGDRPVAQARIREIQGSLFTITRTDGSFMLTAVPPGVHRLQANHGPRASRVVEVNLGPDAPAPDVQLEIDDVERNVVTVRVTGIDGRPKPNAFVFVQGRTLTADASGVARSTFPEGVRSGAPVVAFADNAWAFGELRVAGEPSDPQEATVRFEPTGTLTIRCKKTTGEPQLTSTRAGDLSWMLGRLGIFLTLAPDTPVVINGLPPGTYQVRLDNAGETVAVRAGGNVTVELP